MTRAPRPALSVCHGLRSLAGSAGRLHRPDDAQAGPREAPAVAALLLSSDLRLLVRHGRSREVALLLLRAAVVRAAATASRARNRQSRLLGSWQCSGAARAGPRTKAFAPGRVAHAWIPTEAVTRRSPPHCCFDEPARGPSACSRPGWGRLSKRITFVWPLPLRPAKHQRGSGSPASMASDSWIARSKQQPRADAGTSACRLYEGRPLVKPCVRVLTTRVSYCRVSAAVSSA
jgi:hypothetical protein